MQAVYDTMENSQSVNISPNYSQPGILLDHACHATIGSSEHNGVLEIEIRPLWYLKYLSEQT